ncbi:glycosyltransferase family 4 protein [Spirosoma spitsbergense]|uniref:glycosyltransferase family 4 protein n=1 Tax=Spirosoma spitsbergense TaxID=431554 RepID=UPI000377EA59|nr:glycosyltransferase family 1 protein [Spirosoma spitsbergense]
MKVFYDHQAFTLQKYGGISRYYCELIKGINKTEIDTAHLSLLWSNNVHLKEYDISSFIYPFTKRHRLLTETNKIYNLLDAKLNNYDIFHATYFDEFLESSISLKPFITTFYDMTYERLSHKFAELSGDKSIIGQKKKIAKCATHLIAISESTKNDMIEYLDVTPEKVTVIHLASSFSNNTDICPYVSDGNNENIRPYLLYVGNRSGYKNFKFFLCAVAQTLIRNGIRLVCAGGESFTKDEKQLIASLLLNNLVSHAMINDSILHELYKKALAFVFPSLYEGFGIPILEAFACECPCVLSNTSSLPEVAGEAALYINPLDRDSISVAIERIVMDTELRQVLIKRGKIRLENFSWHRTVAETLNVYNWLI